MRATTTRQQTRLDLNKDAKRVRKRIQIKDDTGTWQEWTNLDGHDQVASATVSETVDDAVRTGTIQLYVKRFSDNGSPYISGSRWSGYLDVRREVKIEIAVVPNDDSYTVESSEWVELLHGRIVEFNLGGRGQTTQLRIREKIAGDLQDEWITTDNTYSTGGGSDVEDVCQDIIDDYGKEATPTINVVDASGLGVNSHQQNKGSILQAIRDLAVGTVGFDLRVRWNDGSNAWTLDFYEPDRSQSTPDDTIAATKYAKIDRMRVPLSWVRNAVRVLYLDTAIEDDAGNPTRQQVVRTRTTSPTHDLDGTPVGGSSIDKYGWQFMELAEGGNNDLVTSQSEAENLADAAMSDLSDPTIAVSVELTDLWWHVQLNDLLRLRPDGERFDSDQDVAVTGFTHRIEPTRSSTSLQLQGQPKSGRRIWVDMEVGPGMGVPAKELSLSDAEIDSINENIASAGLTPDIPQERDWDYMLGYVSTTQGFSPDASDVVHVTDRTIPTGMLDPTQTHYARVRYFDRQNNQSGLSPEQTIDPDPIPVHYLDPDLLGSFSVSQSSVQSFKGSSPAHFDLVFDDIEHDNGGWFSTADDDFTAPADGVYRVSLTVSLPDSQQVGRIRSVLGLSGVDSTYRLGPVVEGGGNDAPFTAINSTIALDARDVLVPKIEVLDNSSYSFVIDNESTRFEANRTMGTASRT